mgnify:CR=1 FL=1
MRRERARRDTRREPKGQTSGRSPPRKNPKGSRYLLINGYPYHLFQGPRGDTSAAPEPPLVGDPDSRRRRAGKGCAAPRGGEMIAAVEAAPIALLSGPRGVASGASGGIFLRVASGASGSARLPGPPQERSAPRTFLPPFEGQARGPPLPGSHGAPRGPRRVAPTHRSMASA